MKSFYQKLSASWKKSGSLLCVGLDSDKGFVFNRKIIEATHDLVCAYKPNSAFYESRGAKGIIELKKTCDYLKKNYPDIVIIADAKRGDIGNTNKGYASFVFDYLGADAVTIHPYLGQEAIQPFLDRKEKGSIILCRTSNPGAGEFQDLKVGTLPLYQHIAHEVATKWNQNSNCALVVGATYPGELKIVRRIVKDMPLLVPGIGAQGGDVEKSVKAGVDSHGTGLIINASRSIIFAKHPGDEAIKLKNQINLYR